MQLCSCFFFSFSLYPTWPFQMGPGKISRNTISIDSGLEQLVKLHYIIGYNISNATLHVCCNIWWKMRKFTNLGHLLQRNKRANTIFLTRYYENLDFPQKKLFYIFIKSATGQNLAKPFLFFFKDFLRGLIFDLIMLHYMCNAVHGPFMCCFFPKCYTLM